MQQRISFNEFELDIAHRRLLREGEPVTIYAKTFDLLEFLVENSGRILTKDEILDKVWKGQFVEEANLSVQISALRKALGETAGSPRFLITIPGKGYKFVIDTDKSHGEIVIEKRKLSKVTFEEEITQSEPTQISQNSSLSKQRKYLIIGLILLFGCVGFGMYGFWNFKNDAKNFENIKLSRLTNSGLIESIALSPKDNYVAYVLKEKEGNSLWLRQIGTANEVQILKPQKATFWGTTFSPDGDFIYYSLFSPDNSEYELYRISTLGGIAEKISDVSTSRVTFSPDGKQMAYILTNSYKQYYSLNISDKNGKNKKIISKKEYPDTFYRPVNAVSWSPDGKLIACLVKRSDSKGSYTEIIGIDSESGEETKLSKKRWFEVDGVEWVKDGSGLLVNATDSSASSLQIWFIPITAGEPVKVTNDLNEYTQVNMSSDGNNLVAIQTNSANSIFAGETKANGYKEIVSEVGNLNPLIWTPDEKIIYRSKKDGTYNLWRADLDGTKKQLTKNANVSSRGLCVTKDGNHIIFSSILEGNLNLWRTDSEGKNLIQLTKGNVDVYPRCMPDSETIIFQRGITTKPRLWKVSIADGKEEEFTEFQAKWGAISSEGEKVSYFHMKEDKWKLGFLSRNGQKLSNDIDLPKNHKENTVVWSNDDKSIYYIGADGGVGNIYSIDLNSEETRQVTDFSSRWVSDFAVSNDGKYMALTRRKSFSDVVLIDLVK